MKKIYFVTSNKSKFEEYKKRFEDKGFELVQEEFDLDEGRSMNIKDIVELKVEQAKKLLPGKKFIVDDRGFFVKSLGGFPGPFVKLMLNSFGIKGMMKMMVDEKEREASFFTGVAYFDGKIAKYYIKEERGFIVDKKKGENTRGWNDILKIYGYGKISKEKSLAEYTDNEWDEYIKEISKEDQVKKVLNDL